MKKVGIITFHFVNNYGGVLQTYALQSVVNELGHDAKVIDYRNWFIRFTDAVRVLPITKKWAVLNSGFKTMAERLERIQKIQNFVCGKLKLTKRVNSFSIKSLNGDFDKFICGSDQIWNPFLTCGVDGAYYLDFVDDDNKKIAYAPSMGTGRIPGVMLKRMFTLIRHIPHLSIREKTSEAIVYEGVGRHAEVMVDPTLLVSKEKWERLCEAPQNMPDKYILLYMMQGDDHIYRFARAMKEKYKLPIVEISRYGFNPGFADKVLVNVGIEEFLGLFHNAEYVCTNSYHGFVYAMIFEKKLCLIPSVHFSARIKNLLTLLEMDENDISTYDNLLVKFDYDNIEKVLKDYRNRALTYLDRAIGS